MSIYSPSFFRLSDADYIPKRREISAFSNAATPTVTTTEDHGYEVGQLVRLHVSEVYGMKVDGKKAKVLTVPSDDTFTCDFDTSGLSSFVIPTAPPAFTQAHVVPITGLEDNIA